MFPEKIGRFEIKSELGRGGMATVYLAFDPRFKREVAIKILPPQLLADPVYRARFEREAQTIAAIEHPAIVPVYDYGEENGQLYLVMRYMPGKSLAEKLNQGTLQTKEVLHIIARITSALDQVHARGIVHRDLKPGNILFDQYDEAYLSDFGIARLTEATTTLTGAATVGTPAYMSPEQARGDLDVDGRSDLYAVGAIIFQMLSGKLPYESTTPLGLAMKHITDPIPSINQVRPDLPPALDQVIETAMAKDRTERFQSGQELANALNAATEEKAPPSPVAVRQAGAPQPAQPSLSPAASHAPLSPAVAPVPSVQPPRRRARLPWFVLAGGGLLLLCAAGVFGIGWAAGWWNTSQAAEPTSVVTPLQSDLPYLDDFKKPDSGWPILTSNTGQTAYVDNGDGTSSYEIKLNASNQQIVAVPGKRFTDVVIEFNVTQVLTAGDVYFGAICRYQDSNNYYRLIVSTDGYYSIEKIKNGENIPVSQAGFSNAILPDNPNHTLRAECSGDTLTLSADNVQLTQGQDSDFTSGDVGLLAGTLASPSADLRFTNFFVTQP